MSSVEVKGSWDSQFDPVIEAFRKNFAELGDVGASFALFKEGEKLVDIWGGHRDQARTQAWEEDTIVNVYSTTKTMTFLVSLMLIDRGDITPEDRVAKFWPEFKANGKDQVRFVDLLTHASGLAGFDEPVPEDELLDWEAITSKLAAQAPWWEPGTSTGYHAITQGYLIGEVVRRITGISIGEFFRDEVARPLNADFHIGTPLAIHGRVSDIHAVPVDPDAPDAMAALPPDALVARVFNSHPMSEGFANSVGWREAEIPAANGHGNARSVARAQHVVANHGEAFGVRLLSEKTALRACEEQIAGIDQLFGFHARFGLGYGLPSEAQPVSPSERACFWGGAGGSTIVVDLDEKMSFSYVMNQMQQHLLGDPRGVGLGQAVYQSLGRS